MSWWKKQVASLGVVLFRGDLPDRVENYPYLEDLGITVSPMPGSEDVIWGMRLQHPEWGEAMVACPRNFAKPSDDMLPYCTALRESDRDAIRMAGNGLLVRVEPRHDNVLRDRKLALRYLHALMGTEGVAAYDVLSSLYWTPEMLADELCHNADLDVEALYTMHALCSETGDITYWLHTHGLKEIGFFDFSILYPSDELPSDLYRSIAYNIVEGKAGIGDLLRITIEPEVQTRLLDMREFYAKGDPAAVAELGEKDEDHCDRAVMLCDDPQGGWLNRLFAKGIRPSRALTKGLPENSLLPFSTTASGLMSERARDTYTVFRRTWEELAADGLPMPAIAKIGYVIDGGEPDDREHLWFEVKGFDDDALDGVLVNQPYKIARMKEGDLGRHPVSLLSDWAIITPAGQITPRNASAKRLLRGAPPEVLDELRTALQQHHQL